MILELSDVHAGYGKTQILHGVSFTMESTEVLCLLGPNGAGKSTLFKGILGFLPLTRGMTLCDGEDISIWTRSRMARTIGYIPQSHVLAFQFKTLSIVLMGRTAHLGRYATPSKKDEHLAEKALETLNISHLKNALYSEISGGERQLVLIARALAQNPNFLIMDEPTNNLDYGNQVLVLRHIQALARNGLGILMASHHPDHAFQYASKVLLIKDGRLCGAGSPDETATEKKLNALYDVRLNIAEARLNSGQGSVKVCIPASQEHATLH
ncbi:ABC transporter ATP-binding protein [Desulfolutivibrio sulfoxidireducens]|uniref:ABC transporter ATP-binding protein n=1 Tax=Desulfolutivibrio sulfoxidireducens TaxID=2773299 RepID=UPI00159E022E|nr:ABC transporter ATP-binding protein [Desulfolutivibrio sulfoxidireducens]QLA15782.1 ATP-binding cassette domain-containing protein [Desulfolutivibrio sulfoxidireducens]